MEFYSKGAVMEIDDPDGPFLKMGVKFGDVVTMKVRNGSKIRNLLAFATKKMKEDETRKVIFTGTGQAVTKTVTCVEIMKRQMKNLHQMNKAYFRRTEEIWEAEREGLDKLKVKRQVPALAILLSKDPLDKDEPGYQAPGSFESKWTDEARQNKRRKSEQKQVATRGKDHPKSGRQMAKEGGQPKGEGSMAGNSRRNKKGRGQKEQRRGGERGERGQRGERGSRMEVEGRRRSGDGGDESNTDKAAPGTIETD